jgi:hypothetical protein
VTLHGAAAQHPEHQAVVGKEETGLADLTVNKEVRVRCKNIITARGDSNVVTLLAPSDGGTPVVRPILEAGENVNKFMVIHKRC